MHPNCTQKVNHREASNVPPRPWKYLKTTGPGRSGRYGMKEREREIEREIEGETYTQTRKKKGHQKTERKFFS